ncbi:MAG: hypothetical protein WC935_07255 [Thermoleophilia bacterium]
MARFVHPTGDLEVLIIGIETEKDQLVIRGKMGVWDAKIYLLPKEVIQAIRLIIQPSVLSYVFSLPFRLLPWRSKRDSDPGQ